MTSEQWQKEHEEQKRCAVIKIPRPGSQPLVDARCKLVAGHPGRHEFFTEILGEVPNPTSI